MRVAVHLVLWNFAFIVLLVVALAVLAANRADAAAFALPFVLAVWVLFQGAVFAKRRKWVLICATTSGILLLLQLALLTISVLWNRGFGNTSMVTQSLVFVIWVTVGGGLLLAWFLRAKRNAPTS
jgi:hypothetical protein